MYVPNVVATAAARPPLDEDALSSADAEEDFARRAKFLVKRDVAARENILLLGCE